MRWWRDGYLSSNGECFDIGNTTRAALARFERTGEPYAGSSSDSSAGNGSLMRLAPLTPEIDAVACGSFNRRQPPQIRGTGYVVYSLEAALWAFHTSGDFREGCLLAANVGDDADTTAAIYGQLAGAHYGESGIPSAWLARLAKRALIADFAERIYGVRPRS